MTELIDPRTQSILYKERENALMLQIEQKLAAREQFRTMDANLPWYVKTRQWIKEKVFSFAPIKRMHFGEENPGKVLDSRF